MSKYKIGDKVIFIAGDGPEMAVSKLTSELMNMSSANIGIWRQRNL